MSTHHTHKPPRMKEDQALYFVTFCTFKRRPLLLRPDVPEMLVDHIEFYGRRLKELIAYTVMSDHIHLLMEVNEAVEVSNFLRDFKKRTSKEIKRILDIDEQHIWLRGSFDRCLRCSWRDEDPERYVSYIFANSLKHLNVQPTNFPFHNFQEAVEKGIAQCELSWNFHGRHC